MSHLIFFAIGSNISPRFHYLRQGVKSVRESGIEVERISSLYQTSPVGPVNQPYFLNAVVKAKTSLKPLEILELFQQIQKKWGRIPGIHFGPRTLDMDLLLYDEVKMRTDKLTLPHPRMESRKFVLVPLLEISPSLRNPEGTSYRSLLDKCDSSQSINHYRQHWT